MSEGSEVRERAVPMAEADNASAGGLCAFLDSPKMNEEGMLPSSASLTAN